MHHLIFDRLPGRQRQHHLAITRLAPATETFSHDHDFPELFLVTAGSGAHHCNGRERPLARGMLVGVRPADTHHFGSAVDAPLQFINLALAPGWWSRFLQLVEPAVSRRWASPPRNPIQRVLDEAAFVRCEDQFRRLATPRPAEATGLVAAVALLIGELFAPTALLSPGGVATSLRANLPAWLARICADLHDPELAAQPLSFWQKRSGCTPEHVARACRRHLGMVPTELLNRARVEHVKARLLRGDDKIAFLAGEAGFENLGYFYRVFRRYTGTTPGAWLAAHQATAVVPR
jgi:AraC family transcriptional regulator, dual regulator of chb operon